MLYHKLEQKAQPAFLKTNRVIETFKKKKKLVEEKGKKIDKHMYMICTQFRFAITCNRLWALDPLYLLVWYTYLCCILCLLYKCTFIYIYIYILLLVKYNTIHLVFLSQFIDMRLICLYYSKLRLRVCLFHFVKSR